MGYAPDIYEMITSKEKVEDDEDDQLFYTKIFLDENLRVCTKINFNFIIMTRILEKMVYCP